MSELETERKKIVAEIRAGIPASLGMKFVKVGNGSYELRSKELVVRIRFERYEATLANAEFIDPSKSSLDRRMIAWVLYQILGIAPVDDNKGRPYFFYGKKIAACCEQITRVDRDVWREYAVLKNRIVNRIGEVLQLPEDHPTRQRMNCCDLQWLTDLEETSG